jgi:hypothetical protein
MLNDKQSLCEYPRNSRSKNNGNSEFDSFEFSSGALALLSLYRLTHLGGKEAKRHENSAALLFPSA